MSSKTLSFAFLCSLTLAACAQSPRPLYSSESAIGPGDQAAGGFILRKSPSGGLAFRDLVCREDASKRIFICVRTDWEKPLRYWVMASAFNGSALYIEDGKPVLSVAQAFDADCADKTSSGAEMLAYEGYFGLGQARKEPGRALPFKTGDIQKMLARALCEKIAAGTDSVRKK